jgi:hypothetical protein
MALKLGILAKEMTEAMIKPIPPVKAIDSSRQEARQAEIYRWSDSGSKKGNETTAGPAASTWCRVRDPPAPKIFTCVKKERET